MSAKTLSFITFLFLQSAISTAQNIEKWIESSEKVPVQKIFIHTDSEFYFQNDTLWFKVYLMDSRSGQLIPSSQNVYVNLVDKNGSSVLESIVLSANGQASGNIPIPELMKPGNYLLQALTDYLLNFEEIAWYQKPLSISRLSNSVSAGITNNSNSLIADVTFFPEGGKLLENVTNLVAFKAIDRAGLGMDASGIVRDEKGNTVASFKTDYKGMGMFFLTPEPGKSYNVKINGFPSFRHNFEAIKENLKIQLVNHTNSEVILNIAGNSDLFLDKTFYLANMYRGEVLFYQPFFMEGLNQVLKFDSQILKAGINRLVLLNSDLEPLSERLLFSRHFEINNLKLSSDVNSYKTRSGIQVKIEDDNQIESTEISHLSVSVINKTALAEFGKSQNILSHLLIDSELNGFFETSSQFFIDSEISAEVKLRLLMLTSGWSNYIWNSMPEKTKSLDFEQTAGLDISGVANNLLTEKPIENGEITMVIQKDSEVAFLTQKTDEFGHFIFPGLLFKDTATVHVQAKNVKGGMNTEIQINPPFKMANISERNLNSLLHNQSIPSTLPPLKYRNNTENKKTRPIQLKRKRIVPDSDENDGHFRLYESADFVLDIKQNGESFENVLDYMVGKVPGVDINGNEVRIRGTSSFGGSSTPLFLIDGIPLVSNIKFDMPKEVTQNNPNEDTGTPKNDDVIQSVRSIPINDVDKIEVLKSPQNLASFGINGANGVIAIYTRMGFQEKNNSVAKGVIERKIVGYASKKEFYSPKYIPEVKSKNADYRTTLFWAPEISTNNGIAEFNFFSGDEPGKYSIIVEGITNKGKIAMGEAEFEVLK